MQAYLAWRMFVEAEKEDLREARKRRKACLMSVNHLDTLTEAEFMRRYHLSKEAVAFLSDELTQITDLRSSQRVHRDVKVLTALSFYQSGLQQQCVGRGRHMSQGNVSKYVQEVTEAINHPNFIRKYIRFPTTAGEREEVKRKFFEKFQIPGVIGCIDATHIRISTPKKDIEHVFYCRKNFHSINVQMVCDSDCRILAVNARYGGGTEDAIIWESSHVNTYMEKLHRTDPTCWLLGDSGYPLRPWLMTPCPSPPPGSAEAQYNTLHSTARLVSEKTFGLLKNRWRCCRADKMLRSAPERAAQIITACCVLHNIAIDYGMPAPEEEPSVVEEYQREEEVEEDSDPDLLRGHAARHCLISQLAAQ